MHGTLLHALRCRFSVSAYQHITTTREAYSDVPQEKENSWGQQDSHSTVRNNGPLRKNEQGEKATTMGCDRSRKASLSPYPFPLLLYLSWKWNTPTGQ